MRQAFTTVARETFQSLNGGEEYMLSFRGEKSDFVRFNGNRVRQAGNVQQSRITLTLIRKDRQVSADFDLSATAAPNRQRLGSIITQSRDLLDRVPTDPYLNYAMEPVDSERVEAANLPDVRDAVACIHDAFNGADLTGVWSAGETCSGFANSRGQRNWHSTSSFNFDWSVHQGEASVKRRVAGHAFDTAELTARAEEARSDLNLLARPARALTPGRYRAYLAPEAVAEILSLVSWGGFSIQNHRTKSTPLARMITEGKRLDPRISLAEDHASGFTPRFTHEGFLTPAQVDLIDKGAYAACLAGARSAREFNVPVNAGSESPQSLRMAPGGLPVNDVLEALGSGLYISNLWYCNFSDRNDCRITGMTRFACCWVENGQLVAPIEPMRFDDSLYRLLGDQLVDLTDETTLLMDAGTYGERSTSSMRVPGILVSAMTLAL
ncbi:MAG TPA: metallopeptidase TldD-related protein [Gammaproteobacteria bacterium]